MHRILAASAALPTWSRWTSWLTLTLVVFLASAFRHPAWIPVAVGLAGFTAFATLPVLDFDGPLPFSGHGLHGRGGRFFRWDEVVRVEAGERGDLRAVVVVAGGQRIVPIRVRGRCSRDELRTRLAEHAPDKLAF